MRHDFPAPAPQDLYVELESGDLRVDAEEVDRVEVDVAGRDAVRVEVLQQGDRVSVVAPRSVGFGNSRALRVHLRVPRGSALETRLGSADVRASGPLGAVRVATGSGDVSLDEVTGSATVKTGSGDVRVRRLGADAELKTGSGDILVNRAEGPTRAGAGSGDITVERARGPVSLKSGSGDLTVGVAEDDTALSTASGDLRVDRMSRGRAELTNVSGDIRFAVPPGTPVWTDLSSGTGRVRSRIEPTGPPAEGQDHVEVRGRTVTGDIHLDQSSPDQISADQISFDQSPQE